MVSEIELSGRLQSEFDSSLSRTGQYQSIRSLVGQLVLAVV